MERQPRNVSHAKSVPFSHVGIGKIRTTEPIPVEIRTVFLIPRASGGGGDTAAVRAAKWAWLQRALQTFMVFQQVS
jgi:hypothetical protein